MIFQADSELSNIIIGIITILSISISMFIIGTYTMRWYAKKKRWDNSLKKSFIINTIWLVLNVPFNFLFYFLIGNNIIINIVSLVINVISGSVAVRYIYKKKLMESFLFIFVTQIILFILGLIFGFIIIFIIGATIFVIFNPSAALNALYVMWDIFLTIVTNGVAMTLVLTALGLAGGFALGLGLAIMRIYGSKELVWFSSAYEKLFRGIPILILIFIFAFGMPGLFWYIPNPLDRILASVILALALRSGAYQSQIFRGAILSVDFGQMEAAQALGMSRIKAFRHIILPQALRLAIPSWSNEYAVVIKDTSFAFEVGVIEMTRWAYRWGTNFPELWTWSMGILAITYFLFTFPVTRLIGERQSKKLKELGIGGG
ncbi:MAG: amino acid ABC transporter permease [Promethearchaeota archaeon]